MGGGQAGGVCIQQGEAERESAPVSPPMQADRSRLYDVVLLRVGTMVPPSSAMELLWFLPPVRWSCCAPHSPIGFFISDSRLAPSAARRESSARDAGQARRFISAAGLLVC